MTNLLMTNLGRLRIIGSLEGISLLGLIVIAVPMKHFFGNPELVKILGPIHGALFIFYVINTLSVAVELKWKFSTTTWKILVACIIPFGTFYVDYKILKKEQA